MIDSGPHTVDMYSSLRSIEYKKLIKGDINEKNRSYNQTFQTR